MVSSLKQLELIGPPERQISSTQPEFTEAEYFSTRWNQLECADLETARLRNAAAESADLSARQAEAQQLAVWYAGQNTAGAEWWACKPSVLTRVMVPHAGMEVLIGEKPCLTTIQAQQMQIARHLLMQSGITNLFKLKVLQLLMNMFHYTSMYFARVGRTKSVKRSSFSNGCEKKAAAATL
jgi:hypothetical protein